MRAGVPCALGLGLSLATQATAVLLDYRDVGFYEGISFTNCGVRASASGTIRLNGASAAGLAVLGNDSTAIDAGEWVEFRLRDSDQEFLTESDVAIEIVAVGPGDGDGIPAEVTVDGFDASLAYVGIGVPMSGIGFRSISDLFAVPIAGFIVGTGPDPVRILGVRHTPPEGTKIALDYSVIPSTVAQTFSLCGSVLSGSADLYLMQSSGVGIRGPVEGSMDDLIDRGERLDVTLPEASAVVEYEIYSALGSPQTFDVQGFGPGHVSLGTVPFSVPRGVIDIGSAFSPDALASFSLTDTSLTGYGQSFGILTYEVPEPGSPELALVGLGAVAAIRLRRGVDRGITA